MANPGCCHPADRTEPFPTPFAANPDQFFVEVEVIEIQSHQLADSKPAAVECLEHTAVADPERRLGCDRVEELNDLVDPEQPRQPFRLLRIAKRLSWVC